MSLIENPQTVNKNITPICPTTPDKLSSTEYWVLSILKSQGFASIDELVELYVNARDGTTSAVSARQHMRRILHHLEALGLVELEFNGRRLLAVKLKCMPLLYIDSPYKASGEFGLRHRPRVIGMTVNSQALAKMSRPLSLDLKQIRIRAWDYFGHASLFHGLRTDHVKVSLADLRMMKLRFIRRLPDKRFQAPSKIAGMVSIMENLPTHSVFIILAIPAIFPLALWIPELNGFLLLQDSIIRHLLGRLTQFVRSMWPDRNIEFTAPFKYYMDGYLHVRFALFGVDSIIDQNRKLGIKKEDALKYYARKLRIPLTEELLNQPAKLVKHILTRLLDIWLIEFLVDIDNVLSTHFLDTYLSYKKTNPKYEGLVNEVKA